MEAGLQTTSELQQLFAAVNISATVETEPTIGYTPAVGTALDQAVKALGTPPGNPLEGSGIGGGGIAGIVVGLLLVVFVAAMGICAWKRAPRHESSSTRDEKKVVDGVTLVIPTGSVAVESAKF